ncbi:hypothetical protein ACHAW6_015978 [Cyclotella cf. meneghiniana]
MTKVLRPLIKSNLAILSQKVALLDLLVARNGAKQASIDFQTMCPIVGASIGQHFRHSMDHIELAALVASSNSTDSTLPPRALHYDLRVRGGTLEKDMVESRKRIVGVIDIFQSLQTVSSDNDDGNALISSSVTSYFNLNADSNTEIGLPSTIGRELGFVAHHAIHHMALVKIIATKTLNIKEGELPNGFGKAPSTILFDRQQT